MVRVSGSLVVESGDNAWDEIRYRIGSFRPYQTFSGSFDAYFQYLSNGGTTLWIGSELTGIFVNYFGFH